MPTLRDTRAHLLAWLLAAMAFANAGLYIAYAGIPLVMADAWFFVDGFLAPVYERGLGLADLYVKRGGADDHAQPLQKLLLLANARWLDLDFVAEAFMGLTMALGTYALLYAIAWRDRQDSAHPALCFALLASAMAACLVSLNVGMIFDWSLVTLGYLPHLFAVAAAWACWRSLRGAASGTFVLLSVAIAFALDNMAIIVGASLAAAGLLATLRGQVPARRLVHVLAAIGLPLVAYLLASRLYLHADLIRTPSAGEGALARLLALLPEAPGMLVTMLGGSLAHLHTLTPRLGDGARHAQIALALLAGAAHLWFWWRALRGRWNASVFVAVSMMLMLYASALGIALGRVPIFGVDYLHEPRYVLTWQMGTVAVLLMLVGAPAPARATGTRRHRLAAAFALLLLALQVPLSHHTWTHGRYIQAYTHTMARQMYLLGVDPAAQLATCVPMLTICARPQAERVHAVGFLEQHRLNVYSPQLRQRYRLEAVATAPGSPRVVAPPSPP